MFAADYPMKRRIPTVKVAVAMTVPTVHRMSLVSRFATWVERRLSRFAIMGESRYPGGHVMSRPASRCRWMWNTVWPAAALQLKTVR